MPELLNHQPLLAWTIAAGEWLAVGLLACVVFVASCLLLALVVSVAALVLQSVYRALARQVDHWRTRLHYRRYVKSCQDFEPSDYASDFGDTIPPEVVAAEDRRAASRRRYEAALGFEPGQGEWAGTVPSGRGLH